MPIGPKGQKRPADVIGNAVKVMRIATGGVRPAIPQPPEWQRIGDQINAAFVFARADFVNVQKGRWLIDWLGGPIFHCFL